MEVERVLDWGGGGNCWKYKIWGVRLSKML